MARPTQALIDIAALRHNYALAKRLSGEGNALAVVKANAYGHGMVAVAKALEAEVPAFGVACLEEALELRAEGITKPILLLEGVFSEDEVAFAADNNCWLMVCNADQRDWVLGYQGGHALQLWLKVDTGMHRLGIQPHELTSYYQTLTQCKTVSEVVVATHFASADDLQSDFTQQQVSVFDAACADLAAKCSMANSAGLLAWPQTRRDWTRPGFMLYGNTPFTQAHSEADQLLPVMTLKSAVIALRDIAEGETVGYANTWRAERASKIATVAIGYGDGYPRHAPNGTPVLIHGQRVGLAGRVSMDMIALDVTDVPDVAIGDEVILWGAELPVNEVANHVGTIGYELLTRMPLRTPRVLINE